MTHQGIKTNYNRKLKSSACGSLSNLMNVTSSEADWNICNPRKYYKRMKDMSSDIFSNELPTFVRIKNIRIVDKESFKQSKDYAGNYRVEPPNHEFYDKINTKFDLDNIEINTDSCLEMTMIIKTADTLIVHDPQYSLKELILPILLMTQNISTAKTIVLTLNLFFYLALNMKIEIH